MPCSFTARSGAFSTVWRRSLTARFDAAMPPASSAPTISAKASARRLRDAGWDIGGTSGHMHYLAIETADTLSRVLRDGCPDPDRVAEVVCELDRYRRTVSEGARSRLTLFGDVASTLIANGNPRAA